MMKGRKYTTLDRKVGRISIGDTDGTRAERIVCRVFEVETDDSDVASASSSPVLILCGKGQSRRSTP